MRFVLLLLLIPLPAQAKDLNIYVDYVLRQERIHPDPKIVHSPITQHFIVSEDGSVTETFHTPGKFPKDEKNTSKLGTRLKVENNRTVRRKWTVGAQTREVLVTIDGDRCNAVMVITNPAGEFSSYSTDLNTTGWYRNSEVESTKCKIE